MEKRRTKRIKRTRRTRRTRRRKRRKIVVETAFLFRLMALKRPTTITNSIKIIRRTNIMRITTAKTITMILKEASNEECRFSPKKVKR